jgi:hypothetical protein
VVIRCTARVLKLLGLRPSSLAEIETGDDDWYVNLLWFDRRKCLLLTHSGTMFSVFVPDVRKADLDQLGSLLVEAVVIALDAEGLGDLDPTNARIAKTASRRVLGVMNDITGHIDHALDRYGGVLDVDVVTLNRGLQRALHSRAGSYATPLELIAERARSGR